MQYEPKRVKNNKKETVEFMHGGRVFIVRPGESKLFDGVVAYHALHMVNTGLVEADDADESLAEQNKIPKEIPLSQLSYVELIKRAGQEGVYKPGMNKTDIIYALKNSDK